VEVVTRTPAGVLFMVGGVDRDGHVGDDGAGEERAGAELVDLTSLSRRNNIVIIMRALHVSIRQIGNSQGVVIPKPILVQLGLDSKKGAEMTIEDGALVLRRPATRPRAGWAEAARRIADAGDDELVMGEFGNAEDAELVW
jgi:antitoxin MazE